MTESTEHRSVYRQGQEVVIVSNINGIIEEIIFARGMIWPYYLVEYWQDGILHAKRFHEGDVSARWSQP